MENQFLYAVIKNGIIDNVVVSDDDQSHPILAAMLPDSEVILVTENTGSPIIGGDYVDNVFRAPSPYKSWVWDSASKSWKAPTPRLSTPCFWSETAQAWIPLPEA